MYINMLATLILLAVIFSCQNVLAQVGMGPLNINLISSTKCDGDKGYASIEIVSLNEDTKGFNIDMDMDFPMDESISYKVRADKVQNGQIQEGVFKHKGNDTCKDFDKFLGDLWKKIAAMPNGMPQGCPKPSGHYHVDDLEFTEEDVTLKSFLYGRFLLNIELFKDGEIIFCHVIEFTNNRPGESA